MATRSAPGPGEGRGEVVRDAEIRDLRSSEARGAEADTPRRSPDDLSVHPWPAGGEDDGNGGAVLAALGAIIAALRVRRGHVCLEIGAGAGDLAVTLAQMGCDATYCGFAAGDADLVARRAGTLAVAVEVVDGPWRDLPRLVDGRRFDLVLFDAARSRAADGAALLRLVRESLLAPGGRLALVAEPERKVPSAPWRCDPAEDGSPPAEGPRSPVPASRPGDLAALLDSTGFVPQGLDVPFVAGGRIMVASRKR